MPLVSDSLKFAEVPASATTQSSIVQTPVAFVQAANNLSGTAVSSLTTTFGAATTAGNTLVVGISYQGNNRVSSVTATGATFTKAASVANSTNLQTEIWTAVNVASVSSITVNFSSAMICVVDIAEYSGVNAVGTTGTATGTSTAPSVSITTQDANDWIVAAFGEYASGTGGVGTYAASTGNLRSSGETANHGGSAKNIGDGLADNTTASSGVSLAVSATLSGSMTWAAAGVLLRPASARKQVTVTVGDTAIFSEDVATRFSRHTASDTLSFSDSVGHTVSLSRTASDSSSFSDTAIKSVNLSASDSFAFSDDLNTTAVEAGTGGSTATIAFVQSLVAKATAQTVAGTFTSAVTAGNLIVVSVNYYSAATTISVTDNNSNTYVRARGPDVRGSLLCEIWYAKNISATPNATPTVTVSATIATDHIVVGLHEYSGIDTVSPLDQTTGTNGSSTALDSGPVTTTAAHELVFGNGFASSGIPSPGTGFTTRTTDSFGICTEDQIISSTQTIDATETLTTSASWVMQVATFKAATTGGSNTAVQVTIADRSFLAETTATSVGSSHATLNRTASDAFSFSESLTRLTARSRSVTDTDSFSEALTRLTARSRSASDTTTFSETVRALRALHVAANDTLSFAETLARALHISRSPSDSLTFSESISRQKALNLSVADTLSLSETLARSTSIHRALADALSYSDVAARSTGAHRALAESFSLAETVARAVAVSRTLSDSTATTDAVSRAISISRTAADNEVVSETLARTVALVARAATDSLSLVEQLTRGVGRSAVDTLAVNDTVVRTLHVARSLADALAFSDTANIGSTHSVSLVASDTLTLLDTITRTLSGTRSVSDSLSVAESVARRVGASRTSLDTLSFTDSLSRRTSTAGRTAQDTLITSDSLARVVAAARAIVDALTLSDVASTARGIVLSASDTFSLSDSTMRTIAMNKAVADVLTLLESVQRNTAMSRSLADALSLSDSTSRSVGRNRTASDSETFSDAVTRGVELHRGTVDTLSFAETLSRLIAVHVALADALTSSDSADVISGAFGVMIIDNLKIIIGALATAASVVEAATVQGAANTVGASLSNVVLKQPLVTGADVTPAAEVSGAEVTLGADLNNVIVKD